MVHVWLRPLVVDDAGPLLAVLRDPEIYRWVDEEPPTSLVVLRDRLVRWAARRSHDRTELWLNWAVIVDGGGTAERDDPEVRASSAAELADCCRAEGELPIEELVGYVQATIAINRGSPKGDPAQIGYMIGRRWWGRSIGSRAVGLLFDELRLRWGVTAVEAHVDPRNAASVALLTGRGMSLLGQGEATLHGQPAPEAWYGMPLASPERHRSQA